MAAKMTQSQMVKELAAAVGVPNKVAKSFTTAYAELAGRETKENGMSVPHADRAGCPPARGEVTFSVCH